MRKELIDKDPVQASEKLYKATHIWGFHESEFDAEDTMARLFYV